MEKVFTGFALIVGLLGLAVAGRGVFTVWRSRRFAAEGLTTTGTVIDNQIEAYAGDHGSRLAFRPAVKFRTRAGQEIVAVSSRPGRRSGVVGMTVDLRYDPETPTRMEILTPGLRGDGGAGLIVFGLVLVAMGLAAFFVSHMILDSGSLPGTCDGPVEICGP